MRGFYMELAGSQRTMEKLVDEHYSSLYQFAFRLTGSRVDAEDLTQETFCTAQRKLGQLRDPARIRPWLFSILRNAHLHRARSEKGQRCVSLGDMADFPERLPDPLPEIEPERLQRALEELPEVFRTPVVLYYFNELSYRDIAEQMDLPVGTVMSRLARAKAHLRSRLLQPPAEVIADAPRRASDGL
jgi:RNA polymerase sigma-70 factor (ECF subfamily)